MKLPAHQAAALIAIAKTLPPPKKRRRVRPQAFKQHDVTRAVRAAKAGGLTVTRVEIDPATGRIIIGAGEAEPVGDLDRWLKDKGRPHAH